MSLVAKLRVVVAVGAFLVAGTSALPASAVYQCGPDKDDCKCGMDDPYPCCSNGGNCTWWAWEQACCHWGVGLPGWGNANQWAGNAKANPNYDVLSSPVVGAVANRVSGSYGHVAWVTAVNGAKITVTEQNCWGGWGHDTATYYASYFDGGFIVRHSQCECQAGQTQTQSCGNCGQQARACGSDCKWAGWGTCGGEGACTPGTTDQQACGDCGHQARTCQNDCSWGAYGACAGTDPTGAAAACDTGKKGVCAKGALKCVDGGTECVAIEKPTAEICDGLDNDCNGAVDDSTQCWQSGGIDGGHPSKPPPATSGAAGASNDSTDVNGSVGCTVSAGGERHDVGATLIALAACLGIALRRAKRLAFHD